MSQKNLVIVTKIILLYSIFYVGLKVFVVFRGAWLEANLILSIPFLLIAVIGAFIIKAKKYNWIYAIIGILLIVLVRYFERDWVVALNSYFN